jgi:hypothetical protein
VVPGLLHLLLNRGNLSRAWLGPCLLFWIGCSDVPVPSGFLDHEREPVILLRCQEGRVAAYITTDPPDDVEAGAVPEEAVPIELDSTPSC